MKGIKNLKLEVKYKWKKTDFTFPNSFPGHKHSAIYTWVLVSKNRKKSYYLGETSNLSQRVSRYMRAKSHQVTNFRMKKEMDKSKEVLLYILDIDRLMLNGKKLLTSELESKDIRKGLEGLLIRELRVRKKGHIIHNL